MHYDGGMMRDIMHLCVCHLYKYLFRLKIKKLSNNQKEELRAHIWPFPFLVVMRTFHGT